MTIVDDGPLPQLLEQAEAARDAARARLLRATEAARRLQQQAEQLHAYRDDYRRRAPALGSRGASMELVRCHRDFMARLDQAIEQQAAQLRGAERECEHARAQLVEREMRAAAVARLIERRAAERLRQANRLEARRQDEAAMRRAWTAPDAAPTEF
jgi:flagellar FliJ protein